jgi:hypothetical protein
VDYADAVAAFFVPRREGTALPTAVAEGSPAPQADDGRRGGGKIPLVRPTARAYGGEMKVSFTCAAARAICSPVAAA